MSIINTSALLQSFQEMWAQTSTNNKLILVGMLCVVVGIFSQITRVTNKKRRYKGNPAKAATMEMLSTLDLYKEKSAYETVRGFSRRYDYMMQLSARLPKEDVEPEYNIYVPVDEKRELRNLDAGARIKAWIADNPNMYGAFERAQKSCEKAAEFERAMADLPQVETKNEFTLTDISYKKYREVESKLVEDAIKNARPPEPKFVFHFYHSGAKGRANSEIVKTYKPSELLEICSE